MKKFEGFYFKCQANGKTASFIFGRSTECAFVQIITESGSNWVKFAPEQYAYTKKPFSVRVGDNTADENGLRIDIKTDDVTATAKIKFGAFTPPKYDAMGFFRFLPFMECRHTVVSMEHTISGTAQINSEKFDFSKGRGYIEGDRGHSFPKKYFWLHAFGDDETSVMVSAARIPYLGMRFTGTICIVRAGGREYRLATYRGARVKKFSRESIVVKQFGKTIAVEIKPHDNSHELLSPVRGRMGGIAKESVRVGADFIFTNGKRTICEFKTQNASCEFHG